MCMYELNVHRTSWGGLKLINLDRDHYLINKYLVHVNFSLPDPSEIFTIPLKFYTYELCGS